MVAFNDTVVLVWVVFIVVDCIAVLLGNNWLNVNDCIPLPVGNFLFIALIEPYSGLSIVVLTSFASPSIANITSFASPSTSKFTNSSLPIVSISTKFSFQ